MADMDWGWKRKKRTGEDLFGNTPDFLENDGISEEELNDYLQTLYPKSVDEDLGVSKRNIASLLAENKDKRTIASLARNDELSSAVKVGSLIVSYIRVYRGNIYIYINSYN